MKTYRQALGGITRIWVLCPDGVWRSLAAEHENIDKSELEARAEAAAKAAQKVKEAEEELRRLYPGEGLFRGPLPTHDVEWDGPPGYYVYVLRRRKRRGKYRVLGAIKVGDR